MRHAGATSSRAGSYSKVGSYRVFSPQELPPEPPLTYTPALVDLVAQAAAALGDLEGRIAYMPAASFFLAMYVRKESLLSSQIEGTQASLVDLLVAEDEQPSWLPADLREVVNYVAALNHGLKSLARRPFSVNLLRELHGILLDGTRGQNRGQGEFRRSQNWIGVPGCPIEDADFVPPAVPELPRLLSNLERYYHEGEESHLVRCALLHAQFQTIHPFLDGNGRIGRLLITLYLCDHRVLHHPLLYLSSHLKNHRSEYYERLMGIRNEGDWEGWLEFFLRGVAEVAREAARAAERLSDLEQTERKLVSERTSSANALRLYDLLREETRLSVRRVADRLGVARSSAHRLVSQFQDLGILSEVTRRSRNRYYVHGSMLKILSEGTDPL